MGEQGKGGKTQKCMSEKKKKKTLREREKRIGTEREHKAERAG